MKQAMALSLVLVTLGCVKAPEIVVVDRATALEQQAAGSFADVEQDLARRAVKPGAEALTPDQLQALGIMPAAIVDHTEQTEADRVDALLRQHCLGEGKHGLLVDTHDDCIGASDRVSRDQPGRSHEPRASPTLALAGGTAPRARGRRGARKMARSAPEWARLPRLAAGRRRHLGSQEMLKRALALALAFIACSASPLPRARPGRRSSRRPATSRATHDRLGGSVSRSTHARREDALLRV